MKINQIDGLVDIIKLNDNKDFADSYWLTISNDSGTVEGKFHLPTKETQSLVIFEPGFPGGGTGYFEETMLQQVLLDGHAAFYIRHVGTIINGKYSDSYIVCKEKQIDAKKNNQVVLGTKANHTIADWLVEPKVTLESFSPFFEEIIFVGHSFGPLAGFSSLIDFNKQNRKESRKVKRFVSMAGTLGIIRDPKGRILSQWAEYMDKPWSKERILIGDTKKNVKILQEMYGYIHTKINLFPKHTEFIAIHPWGDKQNTTDELVHIVESLEILTSLNRGYLIVDKLEYGTDDHERIAHDMENLEPDSFSKLVNTNWTPETQISVLR